MAGTLLLNEYRPVHLRGFRALLSTASQQFRIARDPDAGEASYRVETVKYWYRIATEDDRDLLAWHGNSAGEPDSPAWEPHLHVGSFAIDASTPLPRKRASRLHIPTGQVALESVVSFLIQELAVRPLTPSWRRILTDSRRAIDVR